MTTYTVKAYADQFLHGYYIDDIMLGTHDKTIARFAELGDNSDQMVLHGKNLRYDGDVLVGGTVTSIEYMDQSGRLYATMTDLRIRIEDDTPITPTYFIFHGLSGRDKVVGSASDDYMMGASGNDKLFGGKGDDVISGGFGNDVFTGGPGNDEFYVGAVLGDDIITDFDAMGGEGKQDHMVIYEDSYTLQKVNGGKDTLVQFFTEDSSDSVLLRGVKVAQITDEDFIFL